LAKNVMERYLGAILIVALLIFAKDLLPTTPVSAEEPKPLENTIAIIQPVTTQSRFSEKLEEQVEIIERETIYKDDPEMEMGEEKVETEGLDGKITKVIKITFFEGQEYDRELISSEKTPAQDKIVFKGTKIVWKTLDTADGEIKYWRKMRVYATHYDSRCPGCNETTAIGMRAGKGVIAVDPKVIKLRSKVYIPGYGLAVAGDTGGAIKGNIIDLGFEDARTAGWSARFVDIYLL
jgi:3D (Asp-Asp-Asp) domain-containing protein